jgi:hypothetical protein
LELISVFVSETARTTNRETDKRITPSLTAHRGRASD